MNYTNCMNVQCVLVPKLHVTARARSIRAVRAVGVQPHAVPLGLRGV